MSNVNVTLEEIIQRMKSQELSAEENYAYVVAIEDKFKKDVDVLFEKLAGGYIHEIQSKIGFAKNLLNLVIESKGAFDYKKALDSTITQLQDILKIYQRSGVSTQLRIK